MAKAGAFDKFLDRRDGLYQLAAFRSLQQTKVKQKLLFEINDLPSYPKLETMEKLNWDFILKGFSKHAVHPIDFYRNKLLELGAIAKSQ